MSELSKLEEDLQDPGEAQGPVEVQLLGAEVGKAASPSASSSTVSSSAPGEALPLQALKEMITNLMNFLLLKYRAKELTSQAEMYSLFTTITLIEILSKINPLKDKLLLIKLVKIPKKT